VFGDEIAQRPFREDVRGHLGVGIVEDTVGALRRGRRAGGGGGGCGAAAGGCVAAGEVHVGRPGRRRLPRDVGRVLRLDRRGVPREGYVTGDSGHDQQLFRTSVRGQRVASQAWLQSINRRLFRRVIVSWKENAIGIRAPTEAVLGSPEERW